MIVKFFNLVTAPLCISSKKSEKHQAFNHSQDEKQHICAHINAFMVYTFIKVDGGHSKLLPPHCCLYAPSINYYFNFSNGV